MKKRTPKRQPKRQSTRESPKPKLLDSLTGSDALSILKVLAERHDNLAQEIDAATAELLGEVDVEDLAAEVKDALEVLDVEDVWDRSGARRDGYVDPGDAAWQMFDEALEPFREDVKKYQTLSMLKEASLCYQGILKGIYDFDKESSTEYKQWAVDAAAEHFGQILDDWRKLEKGRLPLSEMQNFIADHCPDYVEWGTRLLRSRTR